MKRPFKDPIIIENNVQVWGFCSIHPEAKLGKNVVIGAFTNICGPVEIGDDTRIQGFCFIPYGVTIGKRVLIGPNVTFTNDKYPRVKQRWTIEPTIVKDGASIGAGSVIVPGVTIGENAMIAAGSVVTTDIKNNWLVKGHPARHIKIFFGR